MATICIFNLERQTTWPARRVIQSTRPAPHILDQSSYVRPACTRNRTALRSLCGLNARDIDAALAIMTPDVACPKAFKGGFVRGPEDQQHAVVANYLEQRLYEARKKHFAGKSYLRSASG